MKQGEKILETLKLFNEKAEELHESNFIELMRDKDIGIHVTVRQGQGTIRKNTPHKEPICAFILTFRFFIQDRDGISCRSMQKIYDQLPSDFKEERKIFSQVRKGLNDFLNSEPIIKIQGIPLTNNYIMKVFIYGNLSHLNKEKKKIFEWWMSDSILAPFMVNEFVFILSTVMDYIMYIRNLNKIVIQKYLAWSCPQFS